MIAAHCSDIDLCWYELQRVGKVHRGLMPALGQKKNGWPKDPIDRKHSYAYYTLRQMMLDLVRKNDKSKFIVTGHSLGGALAILFVTVLAVFGEELLLNRGEGVYTYGQPRVGDRQFGEFREDKLKEHKVNYLRFVYCNDMVPRLPLDYESLWFKHSGTCVYYNSFYQAQIMHEEQNTKYFSMIWLIPAYLNAYGELMRGFMISVVMGADYKEGWPRKIYRAAGLLIPGIAAHALQDYNNSTRLGSIPDGLLHRD